MKLKVKLLDSMTKVLPRENLPVTREYCFGSALRGEVFAFQLAFTTDEDRAENIKIELSGPLAAHTRVRRVGLEPAEMLTTRFDDNVLTREPGLFPDPLYEIDKEGVTAYPHQYRAIHFQIHVPKDQPAGKYPFTLRLSQAEKELAIEKQFTLEVVGVELPEQKIEHTEWFYCDCISEYYHCEVWSEEFWKILEHYFRDMAEHGITQILTPILTPPLDTAVGAERPTAQLLEIETDGAGNWTFDFSRLERWVKLARECGLRRFEFSHLFTQWGAAHAPKVVAHTPKGVKRVFGWETDAKSPQYEAFLAAMLGELRKFVEAHELSGHCCIHISDEPQPKDFDRYRENMAMVRRMVEDSLPICDALSHLGLFKQGEKGYPVTVINEVPTFKAAEVEPLWAYYCCGPETETTNRFLHFPGGRTRILGMQLFHYDIAGFLHWGYNFWHSRLSTKAIDPFRSSDADGKFPGGDPFLVYPGEDGRPIDSFRYELIREAFQDHRALELLAELCGDRRAADGILLELCGGALSVTDYPVTGEAITAIRHAINMRIKALAAARAE